MYQKLLILMLPAFCLAVEINVPADYATIAEAINASQNGDTVILADGVYKGDGNRDITIEQERTLIIKSENGPKSCIINCEGTSENSHNAFVINGRGCVLEGVTITHSYSLTPALQVNNLDTVIINCIFTENYGGIGIKSDFFPTVVGCLFAENSIYSELDPQYNSPFLYYIGFVKFEHCTFVKNINITSVNLLFCEIRNCIFWDYQINEEIEPWYVLPDAVKLENGNFVEHTESPNPEFAGLENGDYRLSSSSPCIDASIDSSNIVYSRPDIDGTSRLVGDFADCGAYEYKNPMDFNIDGRTNLQDFKTVADYWLIDYFPQDVAALANNWLCSSNIFQRAVWRFENPDSLVVKDDSGNGNNAILHGEAKIVNDSQRGNVLYFNGESSYMTAPGLKGKNGDFCVSFWAKFPFKTEEEIEELSTQRGIDYPQILFCWGTREETSIFKLLFNRNYGYDVTNITSTNCTLTLNYINSNKKIFIDELDDKWHKFTIISDQSNELDPKVHVFLDIQYLQAFNLEDIRTIPDEDMIIGRNFNIDNPMFLKGCIDDFVVTDSNFTMPAILPNRKHIHLSFEFDNPVQSFSETNKRFDTKLAGMVSEIEMRDSNVEVEKKGLYFSGINSYIRVNGYKGITGMSKRVISMQLTNCESGGIICWGSTEDGRRWFLFIEDSCLWIGMLGNRFINTGIYLSQWDDWTNLTVIVPQLPLPTLNDIIVIAEDYVYTSFGDFFDPSLVINTGDSSDVIIGAGVLGDGSIGRFYNGAIREVVIAENYADTFYPDFADLWLPLESLETDMSPDLSPYKREYSIIGLPHTDSDTFIGDFATFDLNQVFIDGTAIAGANPRSVTGWVRTTDTEGEIIGWGEKGQGTKWLIRTAMLADDYGVLRTEIGDGYIVGNTNICDGNWHHFAVVQEFAYLPFTKLYIDGQIETLSEISPQWISTETNDLHSYKDYTYHPDNISIGGFQKEGQRFYNGDMAKIRVYSRAITADEIKEEYSKVLNDCGV
ncbi:MAG: LamG-like jellyroll fold domain-containing protein [Sedimentisphaeraceae bacterium JB056]